MTTTPYLDSHIHIKTNENVLLLYIRRLHFCLTIHSDNSLSCKALIERFCEESLRVPQKMPRRILRRLM